MSGFVWVCTNCGKVVYGPLTDDNECGCDAYDAEWIRLEDKTCLSGTPTAPSQPEEER